MPTDIYDNAFLSLNGTNVSDTVKSLELTYEVETQDDTAMGDTTRSSKGGLKNWSANVTFHQDFASGEIDSLLFPLVGTTIGIEIRPDAGSVSTSNPKFTGNALINNYKPLGGNVGDLMEGTISLVPSKGAGTSTLVRATS